MRIIRSFLLLLLAMVSVFVKGQNELVDTLVNRFRTQVYNYPQEKVHLTTDRSSYFCGDTIWFRGFVLDASTHVPVKASKYLYVELVNPFDSIVSRVKIKESEGIYQGYIPLETLYAEGDYELVAYTMFMENSGRDFFFRKPIVLISPFSVQSDIEARFEREDDKLWVTVDYKDKNKGTYKKYERMSYTTGDAVEHVRRSGGERVTFNLKDKETEKPYVLVSFGNYKKFLRIPDFSEDISLSFHPEGGYLVPGYDCRVAFKAVDRNGCGIDVSGVVKDNDGNAVCNLETAHCGMGYFNFIPCIGKNYSAEVVTQSGNVFKFPLPDISKDASVLHVDSRGDTLFVSSCGNTGLDSFVLVHQRGRVLASAPIVSGVPQYFLKSWFPAGVIQILLLDGRANVLSERMAFIRSNQDFRTLIEPDSAFYGNRSKVRLDFSLDGYPVTEGSVAVSVTDDKFVSGRNLLPIDAQLLLQSDISGHIEAPWYYFEKTDSVRDCALDILLMTQGWKRYDIPKVLHGEYSEAVYPLEVGQEINGEVRRLITRAPRKGVNVNVVSPTEGFSAITATDENGYFRINGFDHPDGTNYAIQVYEKDGDKIINFKVFEQKFPFTGFIGSGIGTESGSDNKSESNAIIVNSNPALREVLLDEVTIVGHRKEKHSDVYELLASDTYGTDYIKEKNITSLSEIIFKIPGITERNGFLYYRNGIVNFMVNGIIEPGTDSGGSGFGILTGGRGMSTRLADIELMYNIDMIKRVDFLPPHMAVVFGSRATSGGIIVLTLKNVEEMKMDYEPFHLQIYSPLGYQKPAEIYTPEYTVKGKLPDGNDLRCTVYWAPAVKIDSSGNSFVEFYTSDEKNTKYTVTVEGVTDDGNIIKGACKLNIGEPFVAD